MSILKSADKKSLETLRSRLPAKPYCSPGYPGPTWIRPRERALKLPHIQVNGPSFVGYLVFDIDRKDSAGCWRDADLPAPLWEAANPDNGHRHLGYELRVPVSLRGPARAFLAGLSDAMTRRLGADERYNGLTTKNPFHDEHIVRITGPGMTTLRDLYALGGFEPEELRKVYERREGVSALGRNCAVFDTVSLWAYAHVAKTSEDAWFDAVLGACRGANAFEHPLAEKELKHIAKSIANWTWARRANFANYKPVNRGAMGFTRLPPVMDVTARLEAVRARQSAGGKYARAARQDASIEAIQAARATLIAQGKKATQAAVVKATGLGKATVERRWKEATTGQMSLALEATA